MFIASKTWKNFFHNGNRNFPKEVITTAKKNNWALFLSLPVINYCSTLPPVPHQISDETDNPLRSICHLKLHFTVIKNFDFG